MALEVLSYPSQESVLRSRKQKKSHQNGAAATDDEGAKNWGRSWNISFLTVSGCVFMLAFCPFLVLYFWMACDSFSCSITAPGDFVMRKGVSQLVADRFPKPTVYGFQLYYSWLAFHYSSLDEASLKYDAINPHQVYSYSSL